MKLRKLSQLAWDSFWLQKNDNAFPPARVYLVPQPQRLTHSRNVSTTLRPANIGRLL